jgi:hypothetical protein
LVSQPITEYPYSVLPTKQATYIDQALVSLQLFKRRGHDHTPGTKVYFSIIKKNPHGREEAWQRKTDMLERLAMPKL